MRTRAFGLLQCEFFATLQRRVVPGNRTWSKKALKKIRIWMSVKTSSTSIALHLTVSTGIHDSYCDEAGPLSGVSIRETVFILKIGVTRTHTSVFLRSQEDTLWQNTKKCESVSQSMMIRVARSVTDLDLGVIQLKSIYLWVTCEGISWLWFVLHVHGWMWLIRFFFDVFLFYYNGGSEG